MPRSLLLASVRACCAASSQPFGDSARISITFLVGMLLLLYASPSWRLSGEERRRGPPVPDSPCSKSGRPLPSDFRPWKAPSSDIHESGSPAAARPHGPGREQRSGASAGETPSTLSQNNQKTK